MSPPKSSLRLVLEANTCCSVELMFVLFVRYLQNIRAKQLAKAAQLASSASGAKLPVPLTAK